jgi:hypothetical protein
MNMADINPTWHARCVYFSVFVNGIDREEGWVENRLNALTARQRKKWSMRKIRKYLLDSFCHPAYVDSKLHEIEAERWRFGVANGISPKY